MLIKGLKSDEMYMTFEIYGQGGLIKDTHLTEETACDTK